MRRVSIHEIKGRENRKELREASWRDENWKFFKIMRHENIQEHERGNSIKFSKLHLNKLLQLQSTENRMF